MASSRILWSASWWTRAAWVSSGDGDDEGDDGDGDDDGDEDDDDDEDVNDIMYNILRAKQDPQVFFAPFQQVQWSFSFVVSTNTKIQHFVPALD